MNPRLKQVLLLSIGIALFGGLLWALGASWGELRDAAELDVGGLLISFAGISIASFAAAARWKWVAEQMGGTRLGFGRYLHAMVLTRLIGSFTSALAVDLLGRGVALQRAGSERSVGHTASAVIAERMHDIMLPAALLPWALWWRDDPSALAAMVAGFAAVAVLAHGPIVRLGLLAYGRLRRRQDFELPSGPLFTVRAGAAVAASSLARYLGLTIHVYGVATAVGVALSLLESVAITPTAQLSVLVAFTPGALGIQDAGWAAGLGLVGHGGTAIALFVLAQRALFIADFALLTVLTWAWRGTSTNRSTARVEPATEAAKA